MLHGRAAEQAEIEGRIAGLAEGRSFALLVEGPAGIGKTALLRAAQAAASGARVLRTIGHEAETHISYAGLHDLLTPVLDLRERLAVSDAAALAAALALDAPDAAAEPFAVPAALLALLGAAAEDGPVLVIADDAQWLDDATRDALLFVAARLDADGIGLLLAARGDGEEDQIRRGGLEHVVLTGLDDASARAVLGDGPDLAPPVATAVLAACQGNPLALRELARALTREQRSGEQPLPVPPATRAGVRAMFARQLDALPVDTRQALCVLAALGHDPGTSVAAALQTLGLPATALDAARAAGLVVDGPAGRPAFQHPLAASAAYHGAPSAERRAAHTALAAATDHPGRRAWHLSAAAVGPDEDAAAALEAVAAGAAARAAHADAARAAARAAELSPGPSDRARRSLIAAAEHALAGQADRAAELVDRAVADDPAARVEADRVRADIAIRAGRAGEAVALLEAQAQDALQDGDRATAARTLLRASLAHMYTGDMAALIATGERAAALAADGVAEEVTVLAALVRGEGHAALGHGEQAAVLLTAAEPLLRAPDAPLELAEVLAMGALSSAWLERFDRAEQVVDALVDRARTAGAAGRLSYPLTVRSHIGWRRGRWRAALADAGEATHLARETGQLGVLAAALPALARAEAGRGHFDVAREAAEEARALADAAGAAAIALWAVAALGFCELSAGRSEEAATALDRAAAIAADGLPQPALTMFAADHVEALVRLGRDAEAVAATTVLQDAATRAGASWAHAAAARCRMLLAGDDDIDARGAEALEWHARADLPFERARTLLALGERRRRARRRADAREPLQQALEVFVTLGATPWADRARDELRAMGAGEQPADAPQVTELSARELQVALLVADGLTNREVGSALFLSPKTVEHHLGAIYRKLGLRSRTQLATYIAEDVA